MRPVTPEELTRAKQVLEGRDYWYFDELQPKAKERAVNDYASDFGQGYDWWEYTFEDAVTQFKTLGVATDVKQLYFAGFSSQGDGACFTGGYSYSRGSSKVIRSDTNDTELHRVARELAAIQRRYFYRLTATVVKTSSQYAHERTVDVDCDSGQEGRDVEAGDAEAVQELLRDLMRWLYKRLETEYDYQSCGEGAREYLRSEDYHFDEEGKLL